MPNVERVLYDDEHGKDTIIDNRHNVNYLALGVAAEKRTHVDIEGKPLMVVWNAHPMIRAYYVEVSV